MQVVNETTGQLKIHGWAKHPNKLTYDTSFFKGDWPILSRQKQWNYFYVVNDDYLVTMAHTNLGVIKASYINILQIGGDYNVTETVVEDYFGQHVYIDTTTECSKKTSDFLSLTSRVNHPTLNMKFMKRDGEKDVKVDFTSNTDSHTISGKLTGSNFSEGITQIDNFKGDEKFHSFNTKLLVDFLGDIQLNGNTIMSCTKSKRCYGLHDNGRSFGTYMNTWVWGTTTFEVKAAKKSSKVGINISLSEKGQESSGDALWVDDKIYKLDSLVVKKVTDDEWKISVAKVPHPKYPKNKFTGTFKVANRHKINKNMIAIEIDFNSNFGYFSGEIETADGHKLAFKDKFGFVEEMFSRW